MLLDGEIGSDVISEKSLPFERQTQSLLSPLALLSLIFFCVVCLLGQQMGTSHYHRSQFPLTDLTAIFRPFFIHTYTFSPFGKGNRKTRKSLWEFQKRIYLNYASFIAFSGLTILFVLLACTFSHFSQAIGRFCKGVKSIDEILRQAISPIARIVYFKCRDWERVIHRTVLFTMLPSNSICICTVLLYIICIMLSR